jgi:hypothetical protein
MSKENLVKMADFGDIFESAYNIFSNINNTPLVVYYSGKLLVLTMQSGNDLQRVFSFINKKPLTIINDYLVSYSDKKVQSVAIELFNCIIAAWRDNLFEEINKNENILSNIEKFVLFQPDIIIFSNPAKV